MKNMKKALALILSLLFIAALLPYSAFAADTLTDTSLAKSLTVKESSEEKSLIASAAMLLRRAAVREGASKSVWRGFTESFVYTANGGGALSGSRTYTQNGCSYTVKAYSAEGMSESGFISLLSEHPEGVVLRFKTGEGLLLTHCAGNIFYCLDPDPATDTGFLDIRFSAYGQSVNKSQSAIFDSVSYYYAVAEGIVSHTHTYGTEGSSLGVCTECGYTYYLENTSAFSGKGTPAEGLSAFGLKVSPYSASDYIREDGSIVRYTSVNVLAVTKNHYGNIWYKVESPDKKYTGYIWEDNITVSSSASVIITGLSVPENNAVAGSGAETEVTGTVRTTGAELTDVAAAVFAYDSLSSAELNSILYNTLSASSLTKLAQKRAACYAYAENIESTEFSLSRFASSITFNTLSGNTKYIYAVTATDALGSSATVYRAFYLGSGTETKAAYTVRLSVSGSVTSEKVTAGDSLLLPEKSREGYTFLGWAEGEEGSAQYAPGTSYTPEADVTLYAVFEKTGAPAAPKLSASSLTLAAGEVGSLQAKASGADCFTVYTYDASGALLRTESFPDGSLSLAFEAPGTYTVEVEAFAGEEGSGRTEPVTVRVFAPVRVTFMNGDTLWSEQTVPYGGSAAEPAEPTRAGSSFTGWDGSLENICEDTVLYALFNEGSYTVLFTDESGNTLSKQQVAYGESAAAPDAPEKAGYTFLGWSSESWRQVTEDNIVIYPVYIKEAEGEGITVTLEKAETVGSGKLVSYTVGNTGSEPLTGHVVLTGKTSAGETLSSAAGSVFALNPGESFSEKIYVLGTKAALWELSAVSPSGEETLSAAALLLTSGDGMSYLWVSDSELKTLGVSYKKLEEGKQYSTSATETYTTSASSFLDWDKKSGTEETVWGAWSDWQTEPVSASSGVEVEKRQAVTVPAHTEYRYGRWYAENVTKTATGETHALAAVPSLAYAKSVFKNASTTFSKQYSAWSTARLSAAGSFVSKLKDSDKTYASTASGVYTWNTYYAGEASENTEYFWEESRTVAAEKTTEYRYRVRLSGEQKNTFTHKKEAVWSFTSVKNASTRKVYRISANGAVGGDAVTLNGSLGYAAGNRDAIVTVLMSDGAGHENSYTEKITLGANGDYYVTVADISALSVINAPAYVYLEVAGSTDKICIGSFTAGGSSATVRYADSLTGSLLDEQTVLTGENAVAPEAPAHEGYLFTGWSRTGTGITEDTVITAEYAKETYTVIFSDSVAGSVTAVSGIPYGTPAAAPDPAETAGYTFIGWSVPEGLSLSEVTGSMRATAVYRENTHTVTYLSAPKDYAADGTARTDTLAQITVLDGAYPETPEITGSLGIPESMYFIGWSEGAAEPVTSDLILVPLVGCVLEADEVIPSLPGGMYSAGETLTLHAADTKCLSVRYRFNTAKSTGTWTEYDLKTAPAIKLSASGTLEIESSAPDKNTKTVSYVYTVASSSSLPAAPTVKTAAQTDTSTVKVTWGAVKNASGYILTRESDCGEVCTHLISGTTFEDEGVREQRTYTYSVTAYTVSGSFMLTGKSSAAVSVLFYGDKKPVTKITVKGTTSVYTGATAQLEAVVTPTDAAEQSVYWAVESGGTYGTVSSEGVFTALSAGTVTVSARATDGSGVSGTLKITVKEPEKNAATLSVSKTSAKAGSTATVTVSLSEDSNADTVRFTVKYNTNKLTLKTAKKSGLMASESPSVTKSKGYVTFSYEGDTLTESGTLLTMTFTVNSGASGSGYVQIQTEDDGYDLELTDDNGRDIETVISNGYVSVSGVTLGDVDENGTVDVEDAYLVRSYINGDATLTDDQQQAADVNGDGKINSTDITLIRKYIVKLISVFPAEE